MTLLSEEVAVARNWINGIRQGKWNPTPACKRQLAFVLEELLKVHEEAIQRAERSARDGS